MSHAALRLVGITKRYRSNTVLGPIDLSLEEGRIYGLIGENGAGKSTLIRIVMGLSKPTSGTVELIGQRGSAGLRNARSNIGYVPDSSASYPLLSAADNLKARCLEWGLDQRQIPRILDMIGLADAGNKRARSFSLGMRKRLDLGIALLGQPRMLVLDEPTNGLDPLGTIEIRAHQATQPRARYHGAYIEPQPRRASSDGDRLRHPKRWQAHGRADRRRCRSVERRQSGEALCAHHDGPSQQAVSRRGGPAAPQTPLETHLDIGR